MLDLDKIKQDVQKTESSQPVSINQTSSSLLPKRVSEVQKSNFGKGTILLADTSGSMAGEKLTALKDAVREFVEKDVMMFEFNSVVQIVPDVPTLTLVAARGSTAMLNALHACYDERPSNIILITDGQPTDDNYPYTRILNLVAEKGIPIQCIMLPGNVDKEFLENICKTSGGNVVKEVKDLKLLKQTVAGLIEHKTEETKAIQL